MSLAPTYGIRFHLCLYNYFGDSSGSDEIWTNMPQEIIAKDNYSNTKQWTEARRFQITKLLKVCLNIRDIFIEKT